jgi:hypothetical protein
MREAARARHAPAVGGARLASWWGEVAMTPEQRGQNIEFCARCTALVQKLLESTCGIEDVLFAPRSIRQRPGGSWHVREGCRIFLASVETLRSSSNNNREPHHKNLSAASLATSTHNNTHPQDSPHKSQHFVSTSPTSFLNT